MQKILLIIGVIIIATGFLWPWLAKIPVGKLPGDIFINKPGLKVYIPVTSMIIISIIISLIIRLFRK